MLQIAPLISQSQHGNAASQEKKKRFNFRIQVKSLSLNNNFYDSSGL